MMPAKQKNFDFESYAIQQFEYIRKTLDGLNTQFVPREEIMLMRTDNLRAIANLTETVATLTHTVAKLKETDDRQQGAIDANRRSMNYALTLGAIIAALLTAYVTWKVGQHR